MTTQLVIRIDPEKREKLNRISKAEGKTTSQVIRGIIDDYIKEHDISGYIDDLWQRIGNSMTDKGYSKKDINFFIKESRKNKK